MKHSTLFLAATLSIASLLSAQETPPALTLYNDGFAVVRQSFPLELQRGENELSFSGVTAFLEPESVILREPSDKATLSILEQSYRSDPISQGLLLKHFEGQEIDFQRWSGDSDEPTIVRGRIIRSGYEPAFTPLSQSGRGGYRPNPLNNSPVIEVDGQIQFNLPGQPIFPSLPDDSILEPTLNWTVHSSRSVNSQGELAYLSSGFAWKADYNLTAAEDSDIVDFVGWISMENQSGTSFQDAKIKLIAGDVNRIAEGGYGQEVFELSAFAVADRAAPKVEERSFDEYHLYTLPRPTTLLDRQIKQVEFVRATGVEAKTIYVYDGGAINIQQFRGLNKQQLRQNEAFGSESSDDVWVMREIENTEENGLGIALPKGKTRFYRQDRDGQLEFTGENQIDHTPKKETLRIYTGNAFDIIGERTRTNFNMDRYRFADESFEITLKNRKEIPVTVRVVEHLYRWNNWEIEDNTLPFEKVDADTIAFNVELPADSEKTVSYKAHYSW